MIKWFVKKVLGTKNQREVKRLWPVVEKINAFEVEYQGLLDEQLIAKTTQFKERVGKWGNRSMSCCSEAFRRGEKMPAAAWTERKHKSLVRGRKWSGR